MPLQCIPMCMYKNAETFIFALFARWFFFKIHQKIAKWNKNFITYFIFIVSICKLCISMDSSSEFHTERERVCDKVEHLQYEVLCTTQHKELLSIMFFCTNCVYIFCLLLLFQLLFMRLLCNFTM